MNKNARQLEEINFFEGLKNAKIDFGKDNNSAEKTNIINDMA